MWLRSPIGTLTRCIGLSIRSCALGRVSARRCGSSTPSPDAGKEHNADRTYLCGCPSGFVLVAA